jgi:beta-lactamase superfamily II metal-dependent hydrolase
VPELGTIALDLTCADCGRSPRPSETWRVVFIDVGEAATYCPESAEREFGAPD